MMPPSTSSSQSSSSGNNTASLGLLKSDVLTVGTDPTYPPMESLVHGKAAGAAMKTQKNL